MAARRPPLLRLKNAVGLLLVTTVASLTLRIARQA
jgi:hypothetical protein